MAVFTCVMAIGWNEAPEDLWVPFDIDQGFMDLSVSQPFRSKISQTKSDDGPFSSVNP